MMIMRNFTKKAIKCAKAAAATAAFAFCMTKTAEVSQAVSGAVERCIGVVIPSLFAMMIVSGLLVRSGITGAVPRFIGMISEKLLGMEGFMLPVFTFGMFAGYPVGAKMICTEVQCGRLDKNRAALLCGLCYGAGPAFIFGCISGRLYSSPTAGAVLLVSNTAANLILALLLMPKLKRSLRRGIPRKGFSLSADMLTRSVISAGRSMAEICMMIAAFSVFAQFLTEIGAEAFAGRWISKLLGTEISTSKTLFRCVLDVTAAGELPCADYSLLPIISALTSFGGLCVILQVSTVTSGQIPLKPMILTRISAAVISFFACRIAMPFMLKGETVSAAAIKATIHQSTSPVPSVMLILMTAVLFLESYDGSKKFFRK